MRRPGYEMFMNSEQKIQEYKEQISQYELLISQEQSKIEARKIK